MAEALARLVELRIAYPVLPDDERRRDPSFPAKAVTLGKRGFAIAAAVSESGDLQGRSGQTMAAHRRKILAAVLEAESEWERLNPSAAKRWREECEKYGGNGRPAPENLAAVVVEPKRLPADRKALNGIVRRLGKIDPLLRKFLGDGVSKVATGNPSLSLEELVRQLHAKKHPIAAPQQRAEQDST